MNKCNYLKRIAIGGIIFVTLFSSLISLMTESNTVYHNLYLLPLVHGLLMIIFTPFSERMLHYPCQWIIYILYFLRNVITPFFMELGGYSVIVLIRNEQVVNLSIFLMLYETFAVFFVMSFKARIVLGRKLAGLECPFKRFTPLLFIMCLVTLLMWFIVPGLRESYDSIFNLQDLINIANTASKDEFDLTGSSRAFYTIGQMLINYCRFFLSIWILQFVKKRTSKRRVAIFVALLIILVQSLFLSAQLAFFFYVVFFVLFVTIRLFPETKRGMIIIFGLLLIVSVIVMSSVKLNLGTSNDLISNLGNSLQAYLPGIANVAGTVSIKRTNVFSTLFADFYTMIPFRNSIFGLQVENLSDLFNDTNHVAGQILPLIGESYFYFGPVFAPVLPMFFASGAIRANRKMYTCNNIFAYGTYVLLMLYFSTMIICKNLILFGSTFTSTLLPMFVLGLFVEDRYKIGFRVEEDWNEEK